MEKNLFSRGHAPPPAEMRYDLPRDVRSRIIAAMQDHVSTNEGMQHLLNDVGNQLYRAYGRLAAPAYDAVRVSNDPTVQHFFSCDHELALDFIECCFQQSSYTGGQAGVNEINNIFREDGIGYELTPYRRGGILRTGN